ncbi:hypothetical protein OL548_04495 [Lysinibacillus sp. MHQ-1]|nr:hypothetical protein OL548_04495 [Lysinibacillus sp. MHQ-1]
MTNNINSSQGAGYASHLAPQVIQTKFGDINGDGFFETIFFNGDSKDW